MVKVKDDLGIQMQAMEEALRSSEYRHNSLAQAIFEARLTELRLTAAVSPPPVSQVIAARLNVYVRA